mmetsp:Transcript_14404/g.21151  ORF Transcript_14404/g.21151 Transcript_14404/m.21151 type:complete len:454 (+) Transcript_14404:73-1434(+)
MKKSLSHPSSGTEICPGKNGVLGTKLFLNSQKLIVLGQTLTTAGSPSLDLSSTQSHGQISNVSILGLSTAVTSHDSPSSLLGLSNSIDSFRNGSNLVHLKKQTSAGSLLDSTSNLLRVGNSKIITNNLELFAILLGEFSPALPVILIKRILNSNNGEISSKGLVKFTKLISSNLVSIILEVKIIGVFALHFELRGSYIKSNSALVLVPRLCKCLHDKLTAFAVVTGRSKSTLVSDKSGVSTKLGLDDFSKSVVYLTSNLHGFFKSLGSSGDDEILLESKFVTSVTSSVDDIEAWHWKGELLFFISGKVSVVLVERNVLGSSSSLGDSERYSKNGISTKAGLVGGSIELNHGVVNGTLISGIKSNDGRSKDRIDVLNGLENSLSEVSISSISQLVCLVGTGGCSRGNRGTEDSTTGRNFNLYGGVTSGIEDFTSQNSSNGEVRRTIGCGVEAGA